MPFNNPIPNIPGKSLLAVVVDYPPGVSNLPHHHAKSAFVTAYVFARAHVRSQVDDGPLKVYHVGEYFTEKPGVPITLVSENASKTAPAKMLAIFVLDTGDDPAIDAGQIEPDARSVAAKMDWAAACGGGAGLSVFAQGISRPTCLGKHSAGGAIVLVGAPFCDAVAGICFRLAGWPVSPILLCSTAGPAFGLCSVAAPPLFVFAGVGPGLAGRRVPDVAVWIVLWLAAGLAVWAGGEPGRAGHRRDPIAGWRVAHGVAAAPIGCFVLFHLANHLFGSGQPPRPMPRS